MSGARRGFTLWEIALVLAVFGVAMGLVVPAYTSLGKEEDTRPVDAVLRLLRAARRLATEHNLTVSVILDPESGRYRVDTTGVVGIVGTFVDTTLVLERGARLETDSARVRFLFLPTGAAFADSLLVRARGQQMEVVVDPWSGAAHAEAR